MSLNLDTVLENVDQPTLWAWLIGIRDTSEFIYLVPFYGFVLLLIVGYSLYTQNILDGLIIGGFFGTFIGLALVALQLIVWYNVVVMLGFLIVGLILKLIIGEAG